MAFVKDPNNPNGPAVWDPNSPENTNKGNFITNGAGTVGKYASGAWDMLTGKNKADLTTPTLSTKRPDEERALGLQSREMQGEYANLLRAQMAGSGPSVAQAQLAQGRDAAIRGATAAAASARGANAALAGRSAAQGASRVGMQAARDAALIRAQEQLAAQQQFGALAAAQRGQDIQSRQISAAEEQARLNAGVAGLQTRAQVGEGEASRGQLFGGAAMLGLGSISDVGMKDGLQPLGPGHLYSPPETKSGMVPVGTMPPVEPLVRQDPYASPAAQPPTASFPTEIVRDMRGPGTLTPPAPPQPYTPPVMPAYSPQEYSALTAAKSGQSHLLGMSPPGQGGTQDPYAIDRSMMEAQRQQAGEMLKPKAEGASGDGNFLSKMGLGLIGSDPALKTAPPPTARFPDLVQAAAQVQPYGFQYKPEPAAAQGVSTEPRVGIAANKAPGNLENNPVYAPTVEHTQDGTAVVNAPQAVATNIAVTSELARRLDALEKAALGAASAKGAAGKKVSRSNVQEGSSAQRASIGADMQEGPPGAPAMRRGVPATQAASQRAPEDAVSQQMRAEARTPHMADRRGTYADFGYKPAQGERGPQELIAAYNKSLPNQRALGSPESVGADTTPYIHEGVETTVGDTVRGQASYLNLMPTKAVGPRAEIIRKAARAMNAENVESVKDGKRVGTGGQAWGRQSADLVRARLKAAGVKNITTNEIKHALSEMSL